MGMVNLKSSKYIAAATVSIPSKEVSAAQEGRTYDSRPRIIAAWITEVITNSHVHFEFGRYILLTRSGP